MIEGSCLPAIRAVALFVALLLSGNGRCDETRTTAELKAIEDPTILKRRAWLDTEWNRFKDSSHDFSLTGGRFWAWRVSDRQDWALRLKVPFEFHVAGDTPGESNEQGLGDLKLAAGTAWRLSESQRVAVGLEMRFPSATNNMGANVWRPMLFGTMAWDLSPYMTFSPSAEYNKSIKELRGAAPQDFIELFFPVIFMLPDRWSVTPRYEAKVDFANNDHLTHSAKITATRLLEQLPLALSLSIKKSFGGGEKQFQVNFVTTYYFR